ncbi:MAG: hypothetical protein IPL36_07400 [Nigerium sp.]|nr:hypothetical protein [Nigerium sp.]
MTFTWAELDEMVGGLPPSAYKHAAFWKGARSGWPGFTTTTVGVGHSVTFVRSGPSGERVPPPSPTPQVTSAPAQTRPADIILVSCVKEKRADPAPAKDLYTSPLFGKERRHAESSGKPWFILSAKHGLVAPDHVLEPYELRLSDTPRTYQHAWGLNVVRQLEDAAGPLTGKTIEVHAGAAYTDAIRALLLGAGAHVIEPLAGLTLGQRLAWYARAPDSSDSPAVETAPGIDGLVERLRDETRAQTPAVFLATHGVDTRRPGLYSWWVDPAGAVDLTTGLEARIEPGLIYAGLAGATRTKSGKKSTNTLWGRIRGMHLGGNHNFSTFRLSLGSILAAARHAQRIDEDALTEWMHQHLRLIAVPVDDPDGLDALETEILTALDPPLNLHKRPKSDARTRLSQLRRQHRPG